MMASNKMVRRVNVNEQVSEEERERLNEIERLAKEDFPPDARQPARTGIVAQIRRARKTQGLSWQAVAELAGLEDESIVRDIEFGLDAKFSYVESVANALGLKLEAVEA